MTLSRIYRTDKGQIEPDSPKISHSMNRTEYEFLPRWIQQYVIWHNQMRAAFPGKSIFDDPKAPKLLIRTCLGLCGGLNDRLGQLPWDLYIANQTNRVLLLHWHRPVPIENFLQPAQLDWTVPNDMVGFFPRKDQYGKEVDVRASREDMRLVRAYPDLFEGFAADEPTSLFWEEHFDVALHRATNGVFRDKKILRHRLLGHIAENELESRLRKLGEVDLIHWTSSFGTIFRLFFQPSNGVQAELDHVYQQLHLVPRMYSAIHCRVRHPKAHPPNAVVKGKDGSNTADKTGLPWSGDTRSFAISTALLALRCAQTIAKGSQPIYFFSDSADLAQYMSHDLVAHQQSEGSGFGLSVDNPQLRIVARNATENVHIDKQKGRQPHDYYSTFVDFFLAVNARCLTYGVGFYAMFASKVSGTSCRLLYQQESWGNTVNKATHVQVCNLSLG